MTLLISFILLLIPRMHVFARPYQTGQETSVSNGRFRARDDDLIKKPCQRWHERPHIILAYFGLDVDATCDDRCAQ
eukprot:5416599-Amphidinium_carterae.1